jgi:hypothetical protein
MDTTASDAGGDRLILHAAQRVDTGAGQGQQLSSQAAAISRIPGVERSGDRAVCYSAPDALSAMNVCRIGLVLAGAINRGERL